jgi:hypothetical protein
MIMIATIMITTTITTDHYCTLARSCRRSQAGKWQMGDIRQ